MLPLTFADRSTQFPFPRVSSLTQDRAITKWTSARRSRPRRFSEHVCYLPWLAITIFPAIFPSWNSHIDRERGPRVESGRGHEGAAPRCATLCATLHQLQRFKGKCRRSYLRIVAHLRQSIAAPKTRLRLDCFCREGESGKRRKIKARDWVFFF